AVTAVENEELSSEEEAVRVGPAMADALIAGNANGAATPELRPFWRLAAGGGWGRVGIQHAKALLGGLPHKSSLGIDQFVLSVVSEVVVLMTSSKLEQPVVGGNVCVRISDNDVCVADVGRFHSETNDGTEARRDAPFFHAARGRVQLFISHYPLVAKE